MNNYYLDHVLGIRLICQYYVMLLFIVLE